ncbi:MAG: hypothetical protein ACXWW7_12825 [Nocardioides sp.]
MRGGVGAAGVSLALALALAGCGGGPPPPGSSTSAESPSASISTLSPLPMPSIGPPPGEVVADLRQSSRDAALNRFQVWIGNGLDRDIDPTSLAYVDPRLPAPVPGERLRLIPSDSERGYPLALPPRPDCDSDGRRGEVTMVDGDRELTLPVEDEADVVARYVATRCFELAVAAVAALSFADEVPVDQPGEGSVGTLVLEVRPAGRGDGVLRIDSVGGTPLLTPQGEPVWRPDLTVRAGDPPATVELPMVPARCDDHVFMESGGATAFRIRLHLDGEPGELVLRMSSAGASAAIGFARDSCGLG